MIVSIQKRKFWLTKVNQFDAGLFYAFYELPVKLEVLLNVLDSKWHWRTNHRGAFAEAFIHMQISRIISPSAGGQGEIVRHPHRTG